MPSVRVKRGRERPYLAMPDVNAEPTPLPADPAARARSGTVTSYLSAGSGAATGAESVAMRSPRQSLAVPGSPTSSSPNSPTGVRGSVVGTHILRNANGRTRLRKEDSRLRSPGQGTLGDRRSMDGRRSIHSYGGDPQPVDVHLSQEDLEGQIGSALSLPRDERGMNYSEHHHDEIVDHLDVIDPQVATVTNLSNAANSIFLPPLSVYNRRPVMNLPARERGPSDEKSRHQDDLDQHVEQLLGKKHRIRRILWGVADFVSTPVGACTALYGFLCAFWGAAIVLFLAKIINLHNHDLQNFWIEVSSQVTNGLFTATGVGLIPWRVIDTYRMGKIWHYKRLTRKLRAKAGMQVLMDEDDLPDPAFNPDYVHVLSEKQQDELHYQQQKFMASQTWYRPHATDTHKAFPINTALIICLLIDGNSIFQCFLCGCMWGMNRFQRPAWTTGCLIPASFMCALVAAYFIFRGNNKTKKTNEVEGKLREALEMENVGLMNSHLVERDGFTVVERNETPPIDAEHMVIPESRAQVAATSDAPDGDLQKQTPDLKAVPFSPASKGNSTEAKQRKKAPMIP
ncbi:hypothetical protein FRB95_009208 [Tulasnella sp. JGI-2019a]|nr:hypothetical protein FRB95_009208 [Tulasnella sp. JGI-2019a]